MDCAQALALAAAAFVMAGEPVYAPLARAQAFVSDAVCEGEAVAHDAARALEAAFEAAVSKAETIDLAALQDHDMRASRRQGIPDARIHAAVRRPI